MVVLYHNFQQLFSYSRGKHQESLFWSTKFIKLINLLHILPMTIKQKQLLHNNAMAFNQHNQSTNNIWNTLLKTIYSTLKYKCQTPLTFSTFLLCGKLHSSTWKFPSFSFQSSNPFHQQFHNITTWRSYKPFLL